MADLTQLLLATQDPSTRAQAEAQIQQAERNSPDEYFSLLAQELAGDAKPPIARQLAGLLLKNGVYSKDPARNRSLRERWVGISAQVKDVVKQATASALLANEHDVGKAAGQVLAKIGAIEVPSNTFPDLVPKLLQFVTGTDLKARQISLITLGFLCEELVALQYQENININQDVSNQILTAVVQGMRDPEVRIKYEATRAFYHAIVLAGRIFTKKESNERDFVMTVLAEICQVNQTEEVRVAGFECLVQIATEYYDGVGPYMQSVGMLTLETIKTASEKVAIPAMEFWSTICDEELYVKELTESGQAEGRVSQNIIQQAMEHLVPLLMETLAKQTSEEEDEWNLAMAAGTCLSLVAQVVGDSCVPLVTAFVNANYGNADWRYKEAAFLAYGMIMEGTSSQTMRPMVEASYGFVVQGLNDPSVAVRDTIAWTLGQIAKFHPTIVPVSSLVDSLIQKLQDVPRVAKNICDVIQVIAEKQLELIPIGQYSCQTTQLSPCFTNIATGLLQVVFRPDADDKQLRMSGYQALEALVRQAGSDVETHLLALTEEMLNHLDKSFSVPQTVHRECELQGYICPVLAACVTRLRERVAPAADKVMSEALKVIAAYSQAKGGAAVVHEEALLLIIALVQAIKEGFERFMPHFAPHLKVGLENYEDVQVCIVSVGVVGDICRGLQGKIITYTDTILQMFFANLQNAAVDRKIKVAILECFGDVANATVGDFEKYLVPVLQMLQEASSVRMPDTTNPDDVDYMNNLREAVLSSYSEIIHALKTSNKLQLFKEHVNTLLQFVNATSEDNNVSDSVMKAAIGLVGDLLMVFQTELSQHLKGAPFIQRLGDFATRSQNQQVQSNAMFLRQQLQQYGAI